MQSLSLAQLDVPLARWAKAGLPSRPRAGWVRAIRGALGMTASALARRLNITHAGVRKLERSEAQGTITLASLRKIAEALDCELQYALVPRTSLEQMLQQRAQLLAAEELRPVAHSMVLEDQGVRGDAAAVQLRLLTEEFLRGPRRRLW